jgi:hypothetical protein
MQQTFYDPLSMRKSSMILTKIVLHIPLEKFLINESKFLSSIQALNIFSQNTSQISEKILNSKPIPFQTRINFS